MIEEENLCVIFYPNCGECPLVSYCTYEKDLELEDESMDVIE